MAFKRVPLKIEEPSFELIVRVALALAEEGFMVRGFDEDAEPQALTLREDFSQLCRAARVRLIRGKQELND